MRNTTGGGRSFPLGATYAGGQVLAFTYPLRMGLLGAGATYLIQYCTRHHTCPTPPLYWVWDLGQGKPLVYW